MVYWNWLVLWTLIQCTLGVASSPKISWHNVDAIGNWNPLTTAWTSRRVRCDSTKTRSERLQIKLCSKRCREPAPARGKITVPLKHDAGVFNVTCIGSEDKSSMAYLTLEKPKYRLAPFPNTTCCLNTQDTVNRYCITNTADEHSCTAGLDVDSVCANAEMYSNVCRFSPTRRLPSKAAVDRLISETTLGTAGWCKYRESGEATLVDYVTKRACNDHARFQVYAGSNAQPVLAHERIHFNQLAIVDLAPGAFVRITLKFVGPPGSKQRYSRQSPLHPIEEHAMRSARRRNVPSYHVERRYGIYTDPSLNKNSITDEAKAEPDEQAMYEINKVTPPWLNLMSFAFLVEKTAYTTFKVLAVDPITLARQLNSSINCHTICAAQRFINCALNTALSAKLASVPRNAISLKFTWNQNPTCIMRLGEVKNCTFAAPGIRKETSMGAVEFMFTTQAPYKETKLSGLKNLMISIDQCPSNSARSSISERSLGKPTVKRGSTSESFIQYESPNKEVLARFYIADAGRTMHSLRQSHHYVRVQCKTNPNLKQMVGIQCDNCDAYTTRRDNFNAYTGMVEHTAVLGSLGDGRAEYEVNCTILSDPSTVLFNERFRWSKKDYNWIYPFSSDCCGNQTNLNQLCVHNHTTNKPQCLPAEEIRGTWSKYCNFDEKNGTYKYNNVKPRVNYYREWDKPSWGVCPKTATDNGYFCEQVAREGREAADFAPFLRNFNVPCKSSKYLDILKQTTIVIKSDLDLKKEIHRNPAVDSLLAVRVKHTFYVHIKHFDPEIRSAETFQRYQYYNATQPLGWKWLCPDPGFYTMKPLIIPFDVVSSPPRSGSPAGQLHYYVAELAPIRSQFYIFMYNASFIDCKNVSNNDHVGCLECWPTSSRLDIPPHSLFVTLSMKNSVERLDYLEIKKVIHVCDIKGQRVNLTVTAEFVMQPPFGSTILYEEYFLGAGDETTTTSTTTTSTSTSTASTNQTSFTEWLLPTKPDTTRKLHRPETIQIPMVVKGLNGTNVTGQSGNAQHQKMEDSNDSNNNQPAAWIIYLICAILIFVVFVIIVILILWWRRRRSKKNPDSNISNLSDADVPQIVPRTVPVVPPTGPMKVMESSERDMGAQANTRRVSYPIRSAYSVNETLNVPTHRSSSAMSLKILEAQRLAAEKAEAEKAEATEKAAGTPIAEKSLVEN